MTATLNMTVGSINNENKAVIINALVWVQRISRADIGAVCNDNRRRDGLTVNPFDARCDHAKTLITHEHRSTENQQKISTLADSKTMHTYMKLIKQYRS